MNIVYLIGNGFDQNLGLKTSYREFYDYYLVQPSSSPEVLKFKNVLSQRKQDHLWKDLELALGTISTEFDNADTFQRVLLDISDHLRAYIQNESKRLYIKEGAKEKLCEDLSNIGKDLLPATKSQLKRFEASFGNRSRTINIITFNYTNSLEWILSDCVGGNIAHKGSPYTATLNNILHIHGHCDNTILLGVNDESQIGNETMRNSRNLLHMFIKPNANRSIGSNIDVECFQLLKNANLICTFGLSFGETDRVWWDFIRKTIKETNLARVVIYDYVKDLNFSNNREMLREQYRDEARRRLLNNQAEDMHNKIFCETNLDIFNLKNYIEIDNSRDIITHALVG